MSYNCLIKSRSAFLLLFDCEMTSGFLCRSTSLLSKCKRRRKGVSITTMRWMWLRSHKPNARIKRCTMSLHHALKWDTHNNYQAVFVLKHIGHKYNVLFVARPHARTRLLCTDVYWIKLEMKGEKEHILYTTLIHQHMEQKRNQGEGRNLNKSSKFFSVWDTYATLLSSFKCFSQIDSPFCLLLFGSSSVFARISGTIMVP